MNGVRYSETWKMFDDRSSFILMKKNERITLKNENTVKQQK